MKKLLTLLLCLTLIGCSKQKTKDSDNITQSLFTIISNIAVKIESEIPQNQKVICIDAGHQAKGNNEKEPIGPGSKETKPKVTSGTSGYYTKTLESQVNLDVALKLQKVLEERGYKVVMVRTTQNVNISNIERAEIANKAKADACIRLHCNGTENHSVNGFFILTPSSKNKYLKKSIIKKSLKLSQILLKTFEESTNAKNRGISYRDDLTGTNWSKVPTVLIEMGEMYNKKEDKLLSSSTYQDKCAKGIADGLDIYFNQNN